MCDYLCARPLQRTLESTVVAPLARFLVEHSGLHDVAIEVDMNPEGNCQIIVC